MENRNKNKPEQTKHIIAQKMTQPNEKYAINYDYVVALLPKLCRYNVMNVIADESFDLPSLDTL